MFELSVNARPAQTTLKIKTNISAKYRIVLLDIEGHIISEHFLESIEEKIDINDLPEKIYILQIFNLNGQMITYKMFQKTSSFCLGINYYLIP